MNVTVHGAYAGRTLCGISIPEMPEGHRWLSEGEWRKPVQEWPRRGWDRIAAVCPDCLRAIGRTPESLAASSGAAWDTSQPTAQLFAKACSHGLGSAYACQRCVADAFAAVRFAARLAGRKEMAEEAARLCGSCGGGGYIGTDNPFRDVDCPACRLIRKLAEKEPGRG